MAAKTIKQAVKVFYCYAREDKDWRDQLDAHLVPLKQLGYIETWSDRQIIPGTNWQEEIDWKLETADLILILVSAQCMVSDYCWGKEIKRALERHNAGEAHVTPVILRPVMWQKTPLGELQALPQDGKPVIQWSHPDIALENVAQGVSEVVTTLLAKLEQEAIRKQKILSLSINIRNEYQKRMILGQYEDDLAYTLEVKRQREAQLLEELVTLQKEIDQIKSLEKATSASMDSSNLHLGDLHSLYHSMTGQPPPVWMYPSPSPRLLVPPFQPRRDEQNIGFHLQPSSSPSDDVRRKM